METRKLQKVGGGTYTVSVPKEWASGHELGAGDDVRLFPGEDGSLVIAPTAGPAGEPLSTIHVEGADGTALQAILRAAYAAGVRRIEIESIEDAGTRRRVDGVVRDRTGMRVVEESDAGVVVETVLDDREVSLQRSLVQLRFVTLSLFRTAVDIALGTRESGAERVGDRRADASAIAALVARQFGRSLSCPGVQADFELGPAPAFDCYRTARALDRVAGYAVQIEAQSPLALEADAIDRVRSLADGTRLYVEEATAAVIDGDGAAAIEALRSTRADLRTVFEESPDPPTAEIEPRLRWLLESCAQSGDRIATVAHQAALRRESMGP